MTRQKMFPIIICLLVIQLFTAGVASGKCPYRGYEITGIAQGEKTNQGIADAKLLFFFDEEQGTFANGYETKYPDYFKTDALGAFKATAHFDSYSGWGFGRDRCNRKPKKLTVIITAEGYLAKRVVYKLKKILDPDNRISLPPIQLSK